MKRTHYGQHGPDCYGCKLVTIQFGNVEAPPERLREQRIDKDLPAYKRLREQGYQPPSTQNCHELEARASTDGEVATGKLVDKKTLKEAGRLRDTMAEIAEGTQRAKEAGYTIDDLRSWRKVKVDA